MCVQSTACCQVSVSRQPLQRYKSHCNATAATHDTPGQLKLLEGSSLALCRPSCLLPPLSHRYANFNGSVPVLPGEFSRLQRLQHLNLGMCSFGGLPPAVAAVTGLTHLGIALPNISSAEADQVRCCCRRCPCRRCRCHCCRRLAQNGAGVLRSPEESAASCVVMQCDTRFQAGLLCAGRCRHVCTVLRWR